MLCSVGSAQNPTEGVYSTPPNPLVGGLGVVVPPQEHLPPRQIPDYAGFVPEQSKLLERVPLQRKGRETLMNIVYSSLTCV